MSFLNSALQLERRYPDGVSYNSCPFSNATRIPLVDVGADQPEVMVGGRAEKQPLSTHDTVTLVQELSVNLDRIKCPDCNEVS